MPYKYLWQGHSVNMLQIVLLIMCPLMSEGPSNPAEHQAISIDSLLRNVEKFAWSLNGEFRLKVFVFAGYYSILKSIKNLVETTLRGDGGRPRSSTSRIAYNFRSFLMFIAGQGLFTQPDMAYLLEACEGIRQDLDRTAKVNRIMEEYVSHVQENHYNVHYPADRVYWCEYEVEKVSSRKLIFLHKIGAEEGELTCGFVVLYFDRNLTLRLSDYRNTSCLTRIPTILSSIIRVGDIFTVQLFYMEDKKVWVPYMYS